MFLERVENRPINLIASGLMLRAEETPRAIPRGTSTVKVAHQVEHQENSKHKSQAAAAADRTAIGVTAAAAEEDKDNDNEK
jgi:hypothetical protein